MLLAASVAIAGGEADAHQVAPSGGPRDTSALAADVLAVGGLNLPRSVTVDGSGNVFVADSGNHRVVKLSTAGVETVVPFTGLDTISGLAVDGVGNLYAGSHGQVMKLTPSGVQTTLPHAQFSRVDGVTADAAGNVWLTTYGDRAWTVTSDGVIGFWLYNSACKATGIAVDPSDQVFMGCSGAKTVIKFGNPTPLPFTGLGDPYGVAVDGAGSVLVADATNNRVVKMTTANVQSTLPITGLSDPRGVAVDDNQNVYVADTANNRIVKVTPGGDQSTLDFSGVSLPAAPTEVTATPGDGLANVSWTAPSDPAKAPITGYIVTPYIGPTAQTPVTFESTGTSQAISGLANGTAYTFKVSAINGGGTGPQSAPSNAVVAGTSLAPTIGLATPGNEQATVTWNAPTSPGGSPLTGYVVTPYIGTTALTGRWFNSTDTSQNLDGLTAGTTYTFKVAGRNSFGTGPQSAASNPVTPTPSPTTGLLRVTSSPGLPTQIKVDGYIADSWGLTWVKQPPGTHNVCFGAVPGFTTPACQTVNITAGATTVATGTFIERGYLHVSTSPAVASRISVDGIPRNNWGLWTDLPTGSHQVCFGAVAGYTPPSCQTVNVTAGVTTNVTGAFTPSVGAAGLTGVGYLRVTTSPALPSQIIVDDVPADTWGLNWLEITPGVHTVCFTRVQGYTEPGCQTINVGTGSTAIVTGTFVQRGYLKIQTSPSVPGTISIAGVPVNDWGDWTDRPTGTYHVCFGDVPTATTPPCQDVAVTAGSTTTVTGTYT